MVEVLGTAELEAWFLGLDPSDSRAVARGVGLLEAKGTALGFPYCSAIAGSRYSLRELAYPERRAPSPDLLRVRSAAAGGPAARG
jgi:hypothetical protein